MADLNAFGLEVAPDEPAAEEAPEESITAESPQTEEAVAEGLPAEEAAPEVDPAAEPEVEIPQEEQDPALDSVPEEAPEEPESRLYANKFQSPEELERGYNESREMWRRANEARKAEAQEKLAAQEQLAAMYQQMEQTVPLIQQAAQREAAIREFAERYKAQYGEYPEGLTPPAPPPAPGPQDVQAIVDQRLAQERAAWEAQFAEQQEYQAVDGAVRTLYANHPELDPNDEQASELIHDAYVELNQSWDRFGIELDRTDPGSIEVLYEASKDAALLEVLKLRPEYFESEYGMELARRDAAILSGRAPATTESTASVPASQVKTSGARKPYQESAAVGASAPETEDQNDPWARIKSLPSDGGASTPAARSVFFE